MAGVADYLKWQQDLAGTLMAWAEEMRLIYPVYGRKELWASAREMYEAFSQTARTYSLKQRPDVRMLVMMADVAQLRFASLSDVYQVDYLLDSIIHNAQVIIHGKAP